MINKREKNTLLISPRGFSMYVTPDCAHSYSNFEPLSSYFVLHLYNQSGIFIDIGAHYGYYSLLIGTNNKKVKIHAFEPTPSTFAILQENITLNGIQEKISLHRFALSDKNTNVGMYLPNDLSSKSSLYKLLSDRGSVVYKTKAVTADSIFEDKSVSFIKIDAEGHEISIIKGLKNTINNNHDISMLVEFHPDNLLSAHRQPEELLDILYKHKFKLFLIVDHPIFVHKNIKNKFNKSLIVSLDKATEWKNVIVQHGRGNLLCIKETNQPIRKIKKALSQIESAKYSPIFHNEELFMKKTVELLQEVTLLRERKNHLLKTYFYAFWRFFVKVKKL